MGMTPEGKIKKKLDTMLKALGEKGVWYFSPQAGAFGRAGIPDRIICCRGRFVSVEAKADARKKPTALQKQCMGKIGAAGGTWFVVFDDKTIEAVKTYLEGLIAEAAQRRF